MKTILIFCCVLASYTIGSFALAQDCEAQGDHSVSQAQTEFFDIARNSFDPAEIEPYLQNPAVDLNLRDCRDTVNHNFQTALEYAIQFNRQKIALRLIAEPKVRVNRKPGDYIQTTPITAALGCYTPNRGNINIVKALLARPELDINVTPPYHLDVLGCAIDSRYEPYFDLLMADSRLKPFRARDRHVLPSISYAALEDWQYAVSALLKHRDVELLQVNGALIYAAQNYKPDLLLTLLAFPGVDINYQNLERDTALLSAVKYYNPYSHDVSVEVIKALVQVLGIDLNIKGSISETMSGSSATALEILKKYNRPTTSDAAAHVKEAIEILEANGAK